MNAILEQKKYFGRKVSSSDWGRFSYFIAWKFVLQMDYHKNKGFLAAFPCGRFKIP